MQINLGNSGRAGFLNLGSWVASYVARRRRLRTYTGVVREYSARLYPQAMPAWSMIAEERPGECVVYLTYRRQADASQPLHRFFLVRLPDLSVTVLQAGYSPVRWGPFQ